jgi:peptide-methionine (S)-S-oxide reductase
MALPKLDFEEGLSFRLCLIYRTMPRDTEASLKECDSTFTLKKEEFENTMLWEEFYVLGTHATPCPYGLMFMSLERSIADTPKRTEVATLGGGCFWCTEAVFSELKGVEKVEPGYSGGELENPTYEQVCTGATGHAEVVRITFDSDVISFKEILEIFFSTHDPTTLNRQGPDTGTQYRSVIFYHNDRQKTTAEQVIKEITEEKIWESPILTQVEPFKAFYKAEEYHKDYFKRHPEQAYCRLIIAPKISKLQKLYLSKLKLQV